MNTATYTWDWYCHLVGDSLISEMCMVSIGKNSDDNLTIKTTNSLKLKTKLKKFVEYPPWARETRLRLKFDF
jgi:hypothetical protein